MLKTTVGEYIVGVKFSDKGMPHCFDPNGIDLRKNNFCVVEGQSKNEEMVGFVSSFESCSGMILRKRHLRKVLRKATTKDIEQYHTLKRREKYAIETCRTKVKERKLNMKITDVQFNDESNKIVFHFTADKRIDFRELVKDLASALRSRIELWQIGVRDEAKFFSGFGVCGHPVCCARFINDFKPVSIRMAKEQDIILSPTKISGVCGRLMCCLTFEEDLYRELNEAAHPIGALVTTSKGKGEIVDRNLLKGLYTIQDENGNSYHANKDDIKEVRIPEHIEKKWREARMLKDGEETLPPDDEEETKNDEISYSQQTEDAKGTSTKSSQDTHQDGKAR